MLSCVYEVKSIGSSSAVHIYAVTVFEYAVCVPSVAFLLKDVSALIVAEYSLPEADMVCHVPLPLFFSHVYEMFSLPPEASLMLHSIAVRFSPTIWVYPILPPSRTSVSSAYPVRQVQRARSKAVMHVVRCLFMIIPPS